MARQQTIERETVFTGKGLQTGKQVTVRCNPAPSGTGISFVRTDIGGTRPFTLSPEILFPAGRRRTAIGSGKVQVQTVEHFLAALWALAIDNLRVEVTGPELPAMGGSAAEFFSTLKKAGTEQQDAERRTINIREKIAVSSSKGNIAIFPGEGLEISYTIDYPVESIKNETFTVVLDEKSFEEEIASARTFCMKKEALLLFCSGCGRGATIRNTLILGRKGPLGTAFRFPNEPVRHKVLDIVGDLYVTGKRINGKIVAERSGHTLNGKLVKEIMSRYGRQI